MSTRSSAGDVADQVRAVGGGVTQFPAGDEVYANLPDHVFGGFAEYVRYRWGVCRGSRPTCRSRKWLPFQWRGTTAGQGSTTTEN